MRRSSPDQLAMGVGMPFDPIGFALSFILGKAATASIERAGAKLLDPPVRKRLEKVVRQAIRDATEATYDDSEVAGHTGDCLLERDPNRWPILDGTDLIDLHPAVEQWVAEATGAGIGDESQLTEELCRAIVHGIHQEATRGAGVLHPLWNDFLILARHAAGGQDQPRPEFRSCWDPPQAAEFVGRGEELDRLSRSDGHTHVVSSVTGFGGVGKTALAVAWADLPQTREKYPDGRVFLDFHSYSDERRPRSADDALREVARHACGLSIEDVNRMPITDLRAVWTRTVHGRRIVMVWDNVHEVDQLSLVRVDDPECATLVTSRSQLAIAGGRQVAIDVLNRDDAIAMFIGLVDSEQACDSELVARAVVADLYMPVLIVQHAPLIGRTRTLEELVGELETLLTDRTREALDARQDLSYRLLSDDEKYAFRVLGAHPGQVLVAETAAAVMSCDVDEAIDLLDRLVNAGLARRITADADAGELSELGRDGYAYTAHDVVLDYADRVARRSAEEFDATRDALTRCYMDRLAELDTKHGTDRAWFAREHLQVIAVARRRRDQDCADLAEGTGWHLLRNARFALASQCLERARETYEEIGDQPGLADATWGLANVALLRGDHDTAADLLEKARTTYERTGEQLGHANWTMGMAQVALLRGDYDTATELLEQARTACEQTDFQEGFASATRGLAQVAVLRGDHDTATELLKQARTTYEETGEQLGLADATRGLAQVALLRGDHDTAADLFEQARTVFEETGFSLGHAEATQGLAEVAFAAGKHDEGCALLRETYTSFTETGLRELAAEIEGRMREQGCE